MSQLQDDLDWHIKRVAWYQREREGMRVVLLEARAELARALYWSRSELLKRIDQALSMEPEEKPT